MCVCEILSQAKVIQQLIHRFYAELISWSSEKLNLVTRVNKTSTNQVPTGNPCGYKCLCVYMCEYESMCVQAKLGVDVEKVYST